MSLPKVLLIGAGAIGCLVASRLKNCEIHLVARSNFDFLKRNGIQVKSTVYGDYKRLDINLHQSITDLRGKFDHVMICTKTTSNGKLKDQLGHLLGQSTILHLLQNGINTETEFKEKYPDTTIYLYSCFVRATLIDNVLNHSGDTIFTVGCLSQGHDTISSQITTKVSQEDREKLEKWINDHTDFNVSYTDNIQWKRFHKLFWNTTFNPFSVVLDTSVTNMLLDDAIMMMVCDIMHEVNSLAVKLYGDRPKEFSSPEDLIAATRRIYKENGEHTPSMYLDYKNGRECEVEYFKKSVENGKRTWSSNAEIGIVAGSAGIQTT